MSFTQISILLTLVVICYILLFDNKQNNLFPWRLSILISVNMLILILPIKFYAKEILLIFHYAFFFVLVFSILIGRTKPFWIPILIIIGVGSQLFNNLTNIFHLIYFNGYGVYYVLSQIFLIYGCLSLIKLDYKRNIILILYCILGIIDIYKLYKANILLSFH